VSLIANIPVGADGSGVTGSTVRPITEGVPLIVTNDQTQGGLFGWLDDVTSNVADTFGNFVNNAAELSANMWLDDLSGGPGEYPDSTGDVYDSPQNIEHVEPTFVERYKTPLLIGGGVLAMIAVIYAARR